MVKNSNNFIKKGCYFCQFTSIRNKKVKIFKIDQNFKISNEQYRILRNEFSISVYFICNLKKYTKFMTVLDIYLCM